MSTRMRACSGGSVEIYIYIYKLQMHVTLSWISRGWVFGLLETPISLLFAYILLLLILWLYLIVIVVWIKLERIELSPSACNPYATHRPQGLSEVMKKTKPSKKKKPAKGVVEQVTYFPKSLYPDFTLHIIFLSRG